MKLFLVASAVALACTGTPSAGHDGMVERPILDAAPVPIDAAVVFAADFTVENCPKFDAQAYTCTGSAPLSVRFVPMATSAVTRYTWIFGDAGAFGSEIAPSHTYLSPGTYTVRLVASGADGTSADRVHTGFVIVTANALGNACDLSVQCEQGLFCLCSGNAACASGPSHGICASNCYSGQCKNKDVCADLFTAMAPLGKSEPWQAPICLRGCDSDSDCSGGLSCRTLPPGPSISGWVRGCFSAVPGDVGDSCTDASGNLRADLCASGLCVDLGSKGMCSADCSVTSCPPGSDCVVFGDSRKLCLRPCWAGRACSDDPLITCASPGFGPLGYHAANPSNMTATSHCAPSPCTATDDPCAPSGVCSTSTDDGHCVKR